MFGGMWRWLWGSGGNTPGVLGGTWRRLPATLARRAAREPETWRRTLTRSPLTFRRSWRYDPMALVTEGVALTAAASDDREYVFDYQRCPELNEGETLASGVITGGAGLSIGTVSVTTEAMDGVPAGKGLMVRIAGGSAGTTYTLACKATLSNGRVVVIPARLIKVADYDS